MQRLSILSFNSVHPEPDDHDDSEEEDKEDVVVMDGVEELGGRREETLTASRHKHQTLWQRLDLKPLDPEGDWRRSIESLSLMAGVYNMFAIPFLLLTQYRSPPVELLVASALADFTLLFHVVACFLTGVPKGPAGSGEYMDKFRECATHYLKRGPFVLDLVTSLPCTLFIFGESRQGSDATRLAILDAMQALKLLRLYRICGEVKAVFRRNATRIEAATLSTAIVASLMFINAVACIWLAIVGASGPSGGLVDECPGGVHLAAANVTLTRRYGCSAFIATQTLLSVGYERVAEGDGVEAIESVLMLCLILLFAPALHTLKWFSKEMRSHKSEHRQSRDAVLAFMRDRHMPQSLQARAMRHFQFSWDVLQGGQDADASTLSLLPPGLRTEGLKHLHASAFVTVPMFKHTGKYDAFWRSLLERAEVRKYLPGDVILQRGDVLDALFVLKSGEVQDMNEAGTVQRVRRRPTTWGEYVWFEIVKGEVKRSKMTLKAGSGVEVFVLGRDLLKSLLAKDAYMKELAYQYISDQGAIQASEKFRRLWWGLRREKARQEKAEYKAMRMAALQRPAAGGMLR